MDCLFQTVDWSTCLLQGLQVHFLSIPLFSVKLYIPTLKHPELYILLTLFFSLHYELSDESHLDGQD